MIRRRGGIGNVLKTLGISKVEPDVHVSASFLDEAATGRRA